MATPIVIDDEFCRDPQCMRSNGECDSHYCDLHCDEFCQPKDCERKADEKADPTDVVVPDVGGEG